MKKKHAKKRENYFFCVFFFVFYFFFLFLWFFYFLFFIFYFLFFIFCFFFYFCFFFLFLFFIFLFSFFIFFCTSQKKRKWVRLIQRERGGRQSFFGSFIEQPEHVLQVQTCPQAIFPWRPGAHMPWETPSSPQCPD